jgi:hypothetical protein
VLFVVALHTLTRDMSYSSAERDPFGPYNVTDVHIQMHKL